MKHAITNFLGNTAALVVGLSAITTGGAAFAEGEGCYDGVCGPNTPPTQQPGHSETTEIDVDADAAAAAGAEASTNQGQQQTQVFAPTNVVGGNTTDTMNVLPPNTPPASIAPGGTVEYTLTCGPNQEKILVQAGVVADTPVAFSLGIPGTVGFSVATQRSSVVGGDRAEDALVGAMEAAASVLLNRAQQTPAQRFQDIAASCNGHPPQQPYTPTQPNVPPVPPQQPVVPVVPNTPPSLERGSTDTLPPTAYMFFTEANSNG